ncbi:MAG: hypothetical protein AAGA93_06865 [Actinomycetota bacterium]
MGAGGPRPSEPPALLVPLVADGRGWWRAGRPMLAPDGRAANDAVAEAEATGAEHLVALPWPADGAVVGVRDAEIERVLSADGRLDPVAVPGPIVVEAQRQAIAVVPALPAVDVADPWSLAVLADPMAAASPPGALSASAVPAREAIEARLRGDASVADGVVDPSRLRLVVRVEAVAAVGGFDADEPGLGWVELAGRLVDAGRAVHGIDPDHLPFVPELLAGLDPVSATATEGRWLGRRAGGVAGRLRLARYRRRVLGAVASVRSGLAAETGAGTETDADRDAAATIEILDRVAGDAQANWAGLRPDQAQRGIGRRADWRHLLPDVGPHPLPLAVLLGLGPADDWRWLVVDGWVERIVTDLPSTTTPDVVVIGPGASAMIEPAARAVAGEPEAGIIVMVPSRRQPGGGVGAHRSAVEALRLAGLTEVERYLALPDLDGTKRFVPLDHAGGPAWLAGPEPAIDAGRLPPGRRLLRESLRRLAPRAPELFGGVVVVAGGPATAEVRRPPAVVVTSGFDEGSRTVVLPLGPGDGRPDQVIKLTARPRYRRNAEQEHDLLGELARVVPAGLVPEPLDRVDDGRHHAVIESYAGRWTLTDLLNEQGELGSRGRLLSAGLDALTVLARTPPLDGGAEAVTWNSAGFDELIGRWFDRLDDLEGRSASRHALRRLLARRSAALEGQTLPFGIRHFDLGPWNLVVGDAAGNGTAPASPVTAVDWELAPPRTAVAGPVGADHLYLAKYWLHIAAGCRSIDDEQAAFAFLAGEASGGDGLDRARRMAHGALARSAAALDLAPAFLPLLEAHVWAEAAVFTSERRRSGGGDGGSPARYLDTLARHRDRLLAAWPL